MSFGFHKKSIDNIKNNNNHRISKINDSFDKVWKDIVHNPGLVALYVRNIHVLREDFWSSMRNHEKRIKYDINQVCKKFDAIIIIIIQMQKSSEIEWTEYAIFDARSRLRSFLLTIH